MKQKSVFSGDYIYIIPNGDAPEIEIGINKGRLFFHMVDHCDEHKDSIRSNSSYWKRLKLRLMED